MKFSRDSLEVCLTYLCKCGCLPCLVWLSNPSAAAESSDMKQFFFSQDNCPFWFARVSLKPSSISAQKNLSYLVNINKNVADIKVNKTWVVRFRAFTFFFSTLKFNFHKNTVMLSPRASPDERHNVSRVN